MGQPALAEILHEALFECGAGTCLLSYILSDTLLFS